MSNTCKEDNYIENEHGISQSLKENIEHVRDDGKDQLITKDRVLFMNDGMDHFSKTDIVEFADDPRRGARRLDENWSYSDSNNLFETQIIREFQDEEDTEKVMIDDLYLDDIVISAEEEINKLIELHNSEVMSNTPGDFHVKKPYQIPSIGFIDTARILTESGYNSAEKLEDDEDIVSKAQSNVIEPFLLEIDPVSDEDEFWDTQAELNKHDEGTLALGLDPDSDEVEFWDTQAEFNKHDKGTLDLGLDPESDKEEFWDAQTELEKHDEDMGEEENNNDILSNTLGENNKKTEIDRNPQRFKNYGNRHHRKGKLGPNMMFYMSCFLMLSNNPTLGAENETKFTETNKISKGDVKTKHQYRSEEQRLDKRHIDEGSFKAFMCNEEEDVSTADFSLNDPPRCNREDGSAYYPPIEKKAQILQIIRRIPIEVTVCQVEWRVHIGWCGGEYTALNYMHSDIGTMRTKIQPTNV